MADDRHRIDVSSRVQFVPEQSDAAGGRYVFAYTITIKNTGTVAAQLVSRHWIITDADNQVQEVKGEGVVGEQPLLEPGEFFEYTSGCPLKTPFGTMEGTYQMVSSQGEAFDVRIAPFSLAEPYAIN